MYECRAPKFDDKRVLLTRIKALFQTALDGMYAAHPDDNLQICYDARARGSEATYVLVKEKTKNLVLVPWSQSIGIDRIKESAVKGMECHMGKCEGMHVMCVPKGSPFRSMDAESKNAIPSAFYLPQSTFG